MPASEDVASEDQAEKSADYLVHRKVLDELQLDEVAEKRMRSGRATTAEEVKRSLRCSAPRLRSLLLTWVPVLDWLPRYSLRENALGDLISGCSVAIMHLPQGMAYALLASLPPVFGLYTSLYPVLVYFLFGTSRHNSVGTFAVVSIMIGGVTERLAPVATANGTNTTEEAEAAAAAARVRVACSITLLTGIFQILLGVVRFGFVVTYLSEPLVRGYTTGSACHVCVSQLKYLFGVSPRRFSGPLALIYTVVEMCSLLPGTRIPELLVSILALFVLILVKEVNSCYSHKLPLPIPIELIVVIAATIVTHFCGLPDQYGINVVGEIPSGLQAPLVPDATFFSSVIGDAFAIAIVGFAITISMGKTFALKHGYKVDSNQELLALGLCNTVGSFFQCYSVTSSLSRSLVQESTGGKTQVAGVISSIIVLITVLKLGPLFEDLPKAVLSAIVLVNLKGMFKQFLDVPNLWRTNKPDLLVWLVTFLSTLLLNLDLGLAVSVGFAMLTVIFRTQLPTYSILGRVDDTDLYLDTETYSQAKEIPGIKIFRSSTTVYYTNAEMYVEALQEKSGIIVGKLLAEKKKREAKLRRKQEEEEKKEAKLRRKQEEEEKKEAKLRRKQEEEEKKEAKRQMKSLSTSSSLTKRADLEDPAGGTDNGHVNWAFRHEEVEDASSGSGFRDDEGDVEKGRSHSSDTHSIILDMSTTSFVDTVSIKTLKNIFRDFGQVDLDVYLAGCQVCVVEQLDRASFFSDFISKRRLFVTVHDAVTHILHSVDSSCTTQM